MKEAQEDIDLIKRIEELDNSLSIALDVNDKYQRENKVLKKRAEEAEGEVTIVKGIGQNSPEMKALQKEVEELKSELARSKEDHQYDNLVHQRELESLKNPLHNLRNKGLKQVVNRLDELGYDTRWCIIDANYTGALHKRARTFILSCKSILG